MVWFGFSVGSIAVLLFQRGQLSQALQAKYNVRYVLLHIWMLDRLAWFVAAYCTISFEQAASVAHLTT